MADVYRVGVNLMLNNGVSSGLSQIIRQLGTANAAANSFNATLGRMKLAAAGTVAILGSAALFSGFKKLADHGKEVNVQLERMRQAGMSYKEIQESITQAQQTSSKVMTTTYSENLKHMLELRYAFGDTESAMHHLDEVSRANAILNTMQGKTGGKKDQVWEFVKSLEGKGLTNDPKAFSSYLETMTKVVQATGGKVTPEQFFNTFKYGRTATQLWDEGFVGGALPRLIQEMSSGGGGGGSGGPGNALMTGFAKLVQGQMSKSSAQELEFLGLGSSSKIKGAGSMLTNVPSGSLFAKNPYEWTQQILGPAMAKAGIDMKDDVAVAKHVQKLFGVRTVADAVTKMMMQGRFMHGENAPFEKDARLNKQGLGSAAFDQSLGKDPTATIAAFHAQWTRLLETLGKPANDIMIQAMGQLANIFRGMGEIAAAHPEAIKYAIEALAALTAGVFVAGLLALGAAVAGLVGVGGILVAVAAGLAALAALNWESLSNTFERIGPAILSALNTVASVVIAGVPGIFAAIGSAILSALKSAVSGAIGSIGGFSMPGAAQTGEGGAGYSKSPMNYKSAPPARGSGGMQASLVMDGQKVGKLVTRQIARAGSGPIEGSVYPDATRLALRNDTSYVG